MTSIKTIILTITALVLMNTLTGFSQEKTSNPSDTIQWEKISPPNGIEIAPNLFADKTEISNGNWKTYMVDIETIYGKTSEEYLSSIPDTMVWLRQTLIPHLYHTYFSDSKYLDFPVVGITKSQALDFCKWRTDRVAQMFLAGENTCMSHSPGTTPENVFTVERYRDEESIVANLKKMPFPIFRLPTNDEWELLAGGKSEYQNGVDSKQKENSNVKKELESMFCTLEYISSSNNEKTYDTQEGKVTKRLIITANETSFAINIHGLYHTIGNVAEMISEENISKGGSWKDRLVDLKITNQATYESPNCWTGFRCVSSWEY